MRTNRTHRALHVRANPQLPCPPAPHVCHTMHPIHATSPMHRGAVERGAKRIRVHILTDGRDVPDGSSAAFVAQLQVDLAALP